MKLKRMSECHYVRIEYRLGLFGNRIEWLIRRII